MTNADIIIPFTDANSICGLSALVALRTCRATTDAGILALCNNTPPAQRERFVTECRQLDIRFAYVEGPFNCAKCFNLGFDMTHGEHIVYASQDLIFYPYWLDNILSLWHEYPDYRVLCSYSYHPVGIGVGMIDRVVNMRQIQPGEHLNSGLTVHRRADAYRWDEHFQDWEMDSDQTMHMKQHGHKGGFCMNARVDHLVSVARNNINLEAHYGSENYQSAATAYFRQKWGIK